MIRTSYTLPGFDRLATKIYSTAGSLWIPSLSLVLPRHQNVLAVLDDEVVAGSNIVTNVGDEYYAKRGAGQASPTPNFAAAPAGLRLGSGTTAPAKTNDNVVTFITGTGKNATSGYPQANDQSAENTGKGVKVVTYRYDYTREDFNHASVAEGAIVANITGTTTALTRFLFAAPFAKTADNTLTVFVNHQMLGS